MTLTATPINRYTSGANHGTGAYTTPSFTPTAGRKIMVIAFAQSASDDTFEGTSLTIADSDSGITSWASAAASTASPGWGYGTRAWLSEQAASGSAMTVTVDAGSFSAYRYRVDVYECQDAAGIGATMVATDPDGNSAETFNLSASPSASSIVFAAANVALGTGTSTVNEGAGWTEESGADTTEDAWFTFQVMRRTGSTSQAIDWADLATGAGPIGATLIAFELTQSAGGGTTQDLAGAATGQGSASGAASVIKTLGGAAAGSGAASGALGGQKDLAGGATGAGAASGAASVAKPLAGGAAGGGAASGAAAASKPLAGGAAGSSSASGAAGVTKPLGGAAAGQGGASGALDGGATITTAALKNDSGTLLTGLTIEKLAALKVSDLSLAASWTNQATNGAGVLALFHAGLVPGTAYLLVTCNSDGSARGVKLYTAA